MSVLNEAVTTGKEEPNGGKSMAERFLYLSEIIHGNSSASWYQKRLQMDLFNELLTKWKAAMFRQLSEDELVKCSGIMVDILSNYPDDLTKSTLPEHEENRHMCTGLFITLMGMNCKKEEVVINRAFDEISKIVRNHHFFTKFLLNHDDVLFTVWLSLLYIDSVQIHKNSINSIEVALYLFNELQFSCDSIMQIAMENELGLVCFKKTLQLMNEHPSWLLQLLQRIVHYFDNDYKDMPSAPLKEHPRPETGIKLIVRVKDKDQVLELNGLKPESCRPITVQNRFDEQCFWSFFKELLHRSAKIFRGKTYLTMFQLISGVLAVESH